ncbi:zinc finger protein, putative [Entamoeba histolytica HM-1:IMSS-B]|uniref:Zinc finger protein, putative n=6 Tax=Entamoeba histolytica TaxID=5759 RepID=C4M9G4_ENTH1|nr:zinc finger protein, putative [Entamoeba histolytica HM-1:IMSS]EMD48290.1 zinc finger protein, putative [Entamoeba histolytica KU27]EMH76313.1 zinc finger protein, putative [Entamoeba histolytica HM-1:IMSS-B]EMS14341.1 zinc finger protein containing protein [Entamoeba histolytica HM-3:IMSS]ENY64190.1 zinc finger protein, putative [Entamoeba histolytica HM-1:IMSS-A]GAT98308.1 zinc finger protein putative [Entamoeba histolytica]|eukprot:XP_657151.1 zinc finger protein, putative [Entamoeba histolytica HM-1:IMSS]
METLLELNNVMKMDISRVFREIKTERDPRTIKSNEKTIVCQHWLRGMCRKGANCDFLHRLDEERTPACHHFVKYGKCEKPECPFKHEDPQKAIPCEWYKRGFCKHGKKCKHGHVPKLMCPLFYLGFCPYGKKCKFVHPTISVPRETIEKTQPRGERFPRDGDEKNANFKHEFTKPKRD